MLKKLVLGIILIGAVVFVLFKLKPSVAPKATEVTTPKVKPGYKLFTDQKLKYGFSYPENLTVKKCSDIPCASIAAISLRIDALSTAYLPAKEQKKVLLSRDLYCSAAGPMGSIDCKNTRIEDFSNALGFKGYRIYRSKTISGQDPRVVQDIAYVFPLAKVIEESKTINYAGILFSLDSTTEKDFSSLNSIADSFFLF